jgi:hypothetical protein
MTGISQNHYEHSEELPLASLNSWQRG